MAFSAYVETAGHDSELQEALLEGGTYHTSQQSSEGASSDNQLHQRASSIILTKSSSPPRHHAHTKSSILFSNSASAAVAPDSKRRVSLLPSLPHPLLAVPVALIFICSVLLLVVEYRAQQTSAGAQHVSLLTGSPLCTSQKLQSIFNYNAYRALYSEYDVGDVYDDVDGVYEYEAVPQHGQRYVQHLDPRRQQMHEQQHYQQRQPHNPSQQNVYGNGQQQWRHQQVTRDQYDALLAQQQYQHHLTQQQQQYLMHMQRQVAEQQTAPSSPYMQHREAMTEQVLNSLSAQTQPPFMQPSPVPTPPMLAAQLPSLQQSNVLKAASDSSVLPSRVNEKSAQQTVAPSALQSAASPPPPAMPRLAKAPSLISPPPLSFPLRWYCTYGGYIVLRIVAYVTIAVHVVLSICTAVMLRRMSIHNITVMSMWCGATMLFGLAQSAELLKLRKRLVGSKVK